MRRAGGGWPDLVIGGAPKCGTTALFSYLGQHGQVFASEPKEPHYFASAALGRPVMQGDYDEDGYRALFEGCADGQVAAEASTHYLHHAEAVAPFMAARIPDVRLVFCLRDPIERAYSHYLFRYSCAGPYTLGGVGSGVSFERFASDPEVLSMGNYAASLDVFERHFGAEQVLVVLLDELRRDLKGSLARICRHVGIDEGFDFDLSRRDNETEYPLRPRIMPAADRLVALAYRAATRSQRRALLDVRRARLFGLNGRKPPMPRGARAALMPRYAGSIAALEEKLERDLSAWRDVRGGV